MSTIASPRQSFTITGRRDSGATDNTDRSASTSRAPPSATGTVRRNRNALRDYYGLKNAAKDSDTAPATPVEVEPENEIDREGFDAAEYVKNLLANESLESILRVGASLVSETKSLDGEKKALIYDNYSKLIAATQTIRKMRMNMDPLSPTTSTLTPAIEHIAETATELSNLLKKQQSDATVTKSADTQKLAKQKQLVRWVLGGPDRLRGLISSGDRAAAEAEWISIQEHLDQWQGVAGVEEVRSECLEVLKKDHEAG